MNFNKLLPIGLVLVGVSITGCGNNNDTTSTTTPETSTKSSISNNINGVFDGYRYNTDNYNLESSTYDLNYYNGYKKETYSTTNSRFGDGMKGAENIKGNEDKSTKEKISSDINNIYNKEKDMYNNIKNDIKNSITN